MAAQFDATARINVDLRGFARAASEVTGAGGTMSKVFQNLGKQLTDLERVSKRQAEALMRTLSVYQKLATVTQQYATAILSLSGKSRQVTSGIQNMYRVFASLQTELTKVSKVTRDQANGQARQLRLYQQLAQTAVSYANAIKTLGANEEASAKGAKAMEKAFAQLRAILASVSGLSEAEAARINRTVSLYSKLAQILQTVAKSYQTIRAVGQADEKLAQSAQRNAIAQQRLANEQERNAASTRRNELAAQRLVQQQQQMEITAQRAATAQQRLNHEVSQSGRNMSTFSQSSFAVRSALSEIGQSGQQVLQVFQQIGSVLVGSAITQETAFAQVARVVGEANAESVGLLRSFQQIAEEFPISFEEVARIGQLGAQIGVSADQLDQFTRTVAKFALTTGVSAEQTTLLLGRIAEMQDVPISQMENLGSAILALGTASAATEDEILRINESIATVSNVFGLSAQAVTGLSAALATLRVRPELSRGSLTRVFGELDEAISGGSDALDKLAEVMGMTALEVVNLRNSDPDSFFLAFVKGLDTAAGEANNFQGVIRSLGINAVRDIDTFTRLGNNVDVLTESFAMSNEEWRKGTELQRQSEGIFATTANEIQNLADALKNTAALAGGPVAQGLGAIADVLTVLVDHINALGPIIPIVAGIGVAAAAGVTAWVAYQVVLAKVITSMVAMRELQRNLGTSTLSLGTATQVYRGQLGGVAQASQNLAGSLRLANSQMTLAEQTANRYAAAQARSAEATVATIAAHRSLGTSIAAGSAATRQAAANAALMGQAARNAVVANEALTASTFASGRAIAASGAAAAAAYRVRWRCTARNAEHGAATINTTATAGLAGAASIPAEPGNCRPRRWPAGPQRSRSARGVSRLPRWPSRSAPCSAR